MLKQSNSIGDAFGFLENIPPIELSTMPDTQPLTDHVTVQALCAKVLCCPLKFDNANMVKSLMAQVIHASMKAYESMYS